ncbi:MAG: hypothetical protein M5U19_15590 [Microthrixaceae bacterium]|nr:hypothetical protein [Microthrixaceae bacterium]
MAPPAPMEDRHCYCPPDPAFGESPIEVARDPARMYWMALTHATTTAAHRHTTAIQWCCAVHGNTTKVTEVNCRNVLNFASAMPGSRGAARPEGTEARYQGLPER